MKKPSTEAYPILPFARESPYFAYYTEKHRSQMRVSDEHLASVVACAAELVSAMQSVGSASRNLAGVLEKTPSMFQSSTVVAALGGVLQELSSAQDVLAESLELSFSKPLQTFRKEMAKVDDLRRASDRADADAAAATEQLLHGDWAKVEKECLKQKKIAQRRKDVSSSKEHHDSDVGATAGVVQNGGDDDVMMRATGDVSLASVIDCRAKQAYEKRRLAELKRFDLARSVSSLQRRKGLVLAEASVAGLCSLRAFYAQASHAIGDVATAAHAEQTSIAKACEREREPWDICMLRLQRILNQREVEANLTGSETSPMEEDADDYYVCADGTKKKYTVRELLTKAEEKHRVYSFDADLSDLYDESYYRRDDKGEKTIILEGYVYSQAVSSTLSRRQAQNWQRRWFSIDEDALKVKRSAPGWGGQLLRGVLARETSAGLEDDESPTADQLEDEVVATLLLASVRMCDERCAFEVHSAHGQSYRLQCHGDDDCKRWIKAFQAGVEKQLIKGLSEENQQKKKQENLQTMNDESPFTSSSSTTPTAAAAPVAPPGQMLRAFSSSASFEDGSSPKSPSTPSMRLRKQKKGGESSPTKEASPKRPVDAAATLRRQKLFEQEQRELEAAKVLDNSECAWRLAKIESENQYCCDCGDAKPDWPVINLGIVVCLRCSGVHRSLGTHVSKVRSLRLDRISPLELSVINGVGNDAANDIYEDPKLVKDRGFLKPTQHSDVKVLANFVRAKWRDRLFLNPEKARTNLCEAANGRDVSQVLAALADIPNVDAPGTADGLPALHVAAKAKKPTIAQILVLNGAKIDIRDANGRTALDYFLLAGGANPAPLANSSSPRLQKKHQVNNRYQALLQKLLSPTF